MNYQEALVICNNNEYAALFLSDYVVYCHFLDDIVDQDKPVTDERCVQASLNFIGHFATNPWVRQNALQLWPLIQVGFNAWLDSNNMARSQDLRVRLASDVVKGIYHELVFFCALLCGGYEHMRAVSQKREYDYDQSL